MEGIGFQSSGSRPCWTRRSSKPRVPPRIGGEGAQGGQGAAEPRDGLVRHVSIYKFLYVLVKRRWVTLGWWRPRGNEVEESETLCTMIAEGERAAPKRLAFQARL